jgi:large subunit ribosomal protein L3
MLGIVGEKIGMTQIYAEDGAFVPVTVIRVGTNVVCAIKLLEKHGYSGIQVGYGEKREKLVNKPQRGYFKKNKLNNFGLLREFRTDKSAEFPVGAELTAELLAVGDKIDVQGTSKGKGFQGVMKRWHFSGGADSHGCSVSHRVPGSIGQRAYPGRVFPGKKMPGQMGDQTVTLKNLSIAGVEVEQGLVLIRGAVPGARGTKICIYPLAGDFETRVLKSIKKEEAKSA